MNKKLNAGNFGALLILALSISLFSSCSSATDKPVTNKTNEQPSTAADLKPPEVARPKKIADQMIRRGDLDKARPSLQIVAPVADARLAVSKVIVKLALGEESKGFPVSADELNGNKIQLFLDEKPIGLTADVNADFEIPAVSNGEHILRAFPVRPWGESFKNDAAMQTVRFTVGANGQKGAASKTPAVDLDKPLLTFNFPRNEFSADDAILVDFLLSNVRLRDRGGNYRVRYSIDGGEGQFIDKAEAFWLGGLPKGTHRLRLELVDRNGNVVENAGMNSVEKEFLVK